jgi:hypothetical protein
LGSVTAAILLQHLIELQHLSREAGGPRLSRMEAASREVWKTLDELVGELGFGVDELLSTRKRLETCEVPLLRSRYARLEHRLYFLVIFRRWMNWGRH